MNAKIDCDLQCLCLTWALQDLCFHQFVGLAWGMFSWQIQIYLEETDTWIVKLFIYFAVFQMLFSWHFFPRSFLTLQMPFCCSLLPKSEIQIGNKSSPSAVTHICEPKGVENSHGYLEDSSLVLQAVPGHRRREECMALRHAWHWWKTGAGDINPVLIQQCYPVSARSMRLLFPLSWDRELSDLTRKRLWILSNLSTEKGELLLTQPEV